MTATVSRPTFYEGEVLPAADLGATVDYARNQMARHERYLHSWGIATGLELTFADGSVTLSAGIAIDGTGREIVVPADLQLDSTTFDVFPETDPATWYPVFLKGVDQSAKRSSNLTGACGNSQSTSIQETYQVTFGSPGSDLAAAEALVAITDPPAGGGGGSSGWPVLVGFVQWNANTALFTGAQTVVNGSAPQHAGVSAAQVISGSGSLLLATGPATPAGSNPVMAVQITESPAQLLFGALGANGKITPALTVAANGDVTATGKILGTSVPVSVQVQSGVACDGMILPLPLGVDPSSPIYTQVSIRYDSNLTPPAGFTAPIALPLECSVDPATLRVSSRLQWWDAAGWSTLTTVIVPAACDYMLIAAVPASTGG